jgi:hypothetical protein
MGRQTRSRGNEYAGNNRITFVAMQRAVNRTIEEEVCFLCVSEIYPLLGSGYVFYVSAWRLSRIPSITVTTAHVKIYLHCRTFNSQLKSLSIPPSSVHCQLSRCHLFSVIFDCRLQGLPQFYLSWPGILVI